MDSGLEERILPSIRRSQILLIYRNGRLDNLETCGQIACTVRRLPIRFTVGTGGTISVWAQATRSVFCRAESASVADSAEWVLVRRGGEPGDLRSNRVHGEDAGTIRADTGVCPYAYKSRM